MNPLVSIIIPSRDNVARLKPCLDSIETRSTFKNYEIIIIDNNSKKEQTKLYLASIKHKVLTYNEKFNISRISNFAVSKAEGDYIIFLNDDTEVISPDWIERMLEHSQRPEVGAVGVKLLYGDNTIQHAGVLVGVSSLVFHPFEGFPRDHQGYNGLLQTVRECSAVSGACMMTRKTLFEEIGGFDERLAYAYCDTDLCLRLGEKGYSIIYTPYVEVYHYTQSTRPYVYAVNDEEIRYFIERWRNLILQGDPYYDHNLSRVTPYAPKRRAERFVLVDLGLFEESENRSLRKFKRYKAVGSRIVKRHGVRRLVLESLRYLMIKGGR